MSAFNFSQPIFRKKQEAIDIQDLQGLWRIDWKVGKITLFAKFYTRIDQVFLIRSLVATFIFTTAQFTP